MAFHVVMLVNLDTQERVPCFNPCIRAIVHISGNSPHRTTVATAAAVEAWFDSLLSDLRCVITHEAGNSFEHTLKSGVLNACDMTQ